MKRRLLYASSQAYHPRMETIGRSVGWLERPIVIEREAMIGHRAIDLALVGRVPEGVVVAFRGTLPPFFGGGHDGWEVLLDWLNDGLAACVNRSEYPGGVHLGFAESMHRLWEDHGDSPGVLSAVMRMLDQSLLDRRARRHVFVTGHSKGGALANLFAMRAARRPEWREMGISVATIAAARTGNADFAAAYAASRIACLRYEVQSDLVPHLPPGPGAPRWVRGLLRQFGSPLAVQDYHPVGLRVSAPAAQHQRWEGSRRPLFAGLLGRRGAGAGRAVRRRAERACDLPQLDLRPADLHRRRRVRPWRGPRHARRGGGLRRARAGRADGLSSGRMTAGEASLALETLLWRWQPEPPAKGAWHFVTITGEAADALRARAFELRAEGAGRGFGSVRVRAAVEGVGFETSAFPQGSGEGYVLPVKAAVRKAAGVGEGDLVRVEIWI
ncbi:MAG: DUF1905 domain-containing protein [Sphingomonas sp.]